MERFWSSLGSGVLTKSCPTHRNPAPTFALPMKRRNGGVPPAPPETTCTFSVSKLLFSILGLEAIISNQFFETSVSNFPFPSFGLETDVTTQMDRNRCTEPQMSRESTHLAPNEKLRLFKGLTSQVGGRQNDTCWTSVYNLLIRSRPLWELFGPMFDQTGFFFFQTPLQGDPLSALHSAAP